jgi:hypothetical protein
MFYALPRRIREKFRRSKEINQRNFFCLDQRKKNESFSKSKYAKGKLLSAMLWDKLYALAP